VKVYTYNNNIW